MHQMPRRWREGDVLTPHDLTGNEMRKWKWKSERTADVFDAAGVNPLDHYRVSLSLDPHPFQFSRLSEERIHR